MKYFDTAEEAEASGSLPVRGAWIEIPRIRLCGRRVTSLPVRGAWIEIATSPDVAVNSAVAPRKGSVD